MQTQGNTCWVSKEGSQVQWVELYPPKRYIQDPAQSLEGEPLWEVSLET